MVEVEFIKENSIFIRSGSCNRCGKCCIAYDKHPLLGGKKIWCKDLSFDDKGIATCATHEAERPQICIDNPIYPTPCMVPEAIETCGYSWIINPALKKADALKKFNNLCDLCHRKATCEFYNEIIGEINTSLIDE